MKRVLSTAVAVLGLMTCATVSTYSQTPSTQGKEFWVALIPSMSPDGEKPQDPARKFEPYIAISSVKACTVKISNPNTGWSKIVSVNDNSWTEIRDIPGDEWYTYSQNAMPASETAYKHGLQIQATEDISLFCALRWDQSFDATNVLPISAIQSEYIVQTYGPSEKDGKKFNVFTVLAAEDCTVKITPACKTNQGKAAHSPFTINLKKGEVYHVKSAEGESLNGSKVIAYSGSESNTKKIAVFSGHPLANVPATEADRDLLYEQLFPVDYWGREFIVCRSKERDANRILITAQEDNTNVTIYGNYHATAKKTDTQVKTNDSFTLQSGETYEFELSAGNNGKWDNDREDFKGITIIDSTAYIKTSCPCAVLSYETGNDYENENGTEHVTKTKNSKTKNCGAPAMTWISPIEQMINHVVFGVMGTDMTTYHFVNIITKTENTGSMTLNGISLKDRFKPIDNKPDYSYARIKFSPTREDNYKTTNPFYELKGDDGFSAIVYGNGFNESYAYSVGSAAIKQGIKAGDQVLTEGVINDVKYCVGEELDFNAQVTSNYTVDEVDWDFGDGVTELKSQNIQTKHTYESAGWKDLRVKVRAHKDCPYGMYPDIDIKVSFYVQTPDIVYLPGTHECIDEKDAERGTIYPYTEVREEKVDCSRVEITRVETGLITRHTIDEEIIGYDSCLWLGKWRYESKEYTDTIFGGNYMHCDSIVTGNIKILSCLNMDLSMERDTFCADEEELAILYNIKKGGFDADKAWLHLEDGTEVALTVNENKKTMYAALSEINPGIHDCELVVFDNYCERDWSAPLRFVIRYASSSFYQKWNDVLVVPNSTISEYGITAYQWLKNGKEIEGATTPWYYAPDYNIETELDTAAEYSIRLTNSDNVTLESCPMTPQTIGTQAQAVRVAPTMLMPGENIQIETEGEANAEIYNTLGLKKSTTIFNSNTEIPAPREKGIYVLHVTFKDGSRVSKQIVVSR